MSTTEVRAGAVSIREESDGLTIEGTAVVYGEQSGPTAEYGSTPEQFSPGAFRQALSLRRPAPFFNRHGGEMVGAVTFDDGADALKYKGRLFDTPGAAAYREAVRAGIDGASIEFVPGVVQRQADRVMHRQVKSIVAIAGTHVPAYDSARVAVRGEDMAENTEAVVEARRTDAEIDTAMRAVALEATTTLRRELAERDVTTAQLTEADRALTACRSLAELWHAVDTNPELRGVYSRALADQVTTPNVGVLGGANLLGTVKGIVTTGRAAVSAWGREALGGAGMTVDFPYFAGDLTTLVGEQLTQKAEITSVVVSILKGTAPIKTYAGGSDISYQLLRRSDPSYLEAYWRILLASYAVVTEAAFVNGIEATAGIVLEVLNWATATTAQIQTALGNASVKVNTATGSPASFGVAAPDVFGKILSTNLTVNTQNALATGNDAATLAPVVSGLRIYSSPAVNAGNLLVSNEQSAGFHEDGPFQAAEEDVAKLGRNVAVWGMGAGTVYIPTAIIRVAAS